MLVILSLLFGSIATGYACKNIKMVKSFSGMVSLTVLLLLLTLGISVGMQDSIVGNLLNLGIIAFAIAASCAMCLPISTPPNAIAHSTRLVKQKEMLKIGITVGLISLVAGYAVLFFVEKMHFLQ